MQQSRNIARRLAVVVLILFVGVTALGGQNQSRPDQERQRESSFFRSSPTCVSTVRVTMSSA
jgi:hypothetical protein